MELRKWSICKTLLPCIHTSKHQILQLTMVATLLCTIYYMHYRINAVNHMQYGISYLSTAEPDLIDHPIGYNMVSQDRLSFYDSLDFIEM